MKILVFTDPHGNLNLLEKHKETSKAVDAVIITGDLSYAGQGLEIIIKKINEFHAAVYLIHGNHEDEEELAELCEQQKYYFCSQKNSSFRKILFRGFLNKRDARNIP